MLVRHQEFIKYKTYLQNVSPATLRWYTHAFNWLPVESPTQDELNNVVVRMREAGLKATGTNAVIRALNCYLHWNSGSTAKCGAGCTHPHIRPLKEPQFVPVVFDVVTEELIKDNAPAIVRRVDDVVVREFPPVAASKLHGIFQKYIDDSGQKQTLPPPSPRSPKDAP